MVYVWKGGRDPLCGYDFMWLYDFIFNLRCCVEAEKRASLWLWLWLWLDSQVNLELVDIIESLQKQAEVARTEVEIPSQ